MRVLRINRSGVVSAWRERERELVRHGDAVTLLCAARWIEGGGTVEFAADGDDFATPVRTFGRHPNLFLYAPGPLWRALADRTYDVVDVHEEPFGLAMAEILLLKWLRRNRAPFVLYSAQNLDKRYPLPFSLVERCSLRRAAAAQVCNEAAGARLRRRGLRGELVVLPLGVDPGRFRATDREPPQGRLRVGYAGRLDAHKGVHVLFDALAHLDGWEAEIAGDGEERGRLAEQARTLGLADRVHFRGHADQEALAAFYRELDVLVVPSTPTLRWTEQFCRVAVEAMASGVPVVASDAGALPEVVGAAGIIVPAGDAAALKAALEELAADPERWSWLRGAGTVRAAECSWSTVAMRQHELYQRIAG